MTTLGNINQPTGLVALTTGTQDFPTNIIYFNPPVAATLAQVTAAGYLNQYAAQLNVQQMAVVYTSDKGAVLLQVVNSGVTWTFAIPTETVAGVTFTGTLTAGHLVRVNNASGIVDDSGIVAANVLVNTAANQMAAGAAVYVDKGVGTVSTGAVTVNHQAGAITAAVTTAAAATTTFTLNNSLILGTSNLINVFPAGGTNTTLPGVEVSAVATGVGTATVSITNNNVAGTALNGNLVIGFQVL